MRTQEILFDLNKALIPALGCTDPISIAYAATIARNANPGLVLKNITVKVNGALIKNAAAVYIPNTDLYGIANAATLGAFINNPDLKMQLMHQINPEIINLTKQFVSQNLTKVEWVNQDCLTIQVEITTELGSSMALIENDYTHIALVKYKEQLIFEDRFSHSDKTSKEKYSIDEIIQFAKTVPLDHLNQVNEAIQMNSTFSQQETHTAYEIGIGNRLHQEAHGHLWLEILSKTAGASDARMAGSSLPVMSNSGSGNQGLLTLIPIIMMSRALNSDSQTQLRACTLSAAIMMAIKQKFGLMSGICSAVVAACGTAAGLTYLQTQDDDQIKQAIHNTLANVSGIHCDGAKTSCALKVSTCAFAALSSSSLAIHHEGVQNMEGYTEENIDDTIDHLAELSQISRGETDRRIIEIITQKQVNVKDKN